MRHRVAGRKLNRTGEHRLAMRRNLVSSLFEHETVSTTIQKAKEVRSFAEKMITLGKKGDLAARRRAISLLGNRDIVVQEDGVPVKKGTVIGKLFSEIGPRYLDRAGGYTRIVKLQLRRLGDNGQLVLLQLVGENEKVEKKKKTTKKQTEKPAEAVAEETEAQELTEAVEDDASAEDSASSEEMVEKAETDDEKKEQ